MNQGYGPYDSNDERRYQRGRRRSQTDPVGTGYAAPSPRTEQTAFEPQDTAVNQTTGTAVGRRGTRRAVAAKNERPAVAAQEQKRTPAAAREPHRKHETGRERLQTKAGTVRLSGHVISCEPTHRRNDIFHVLYDTLFKGARLSFAPVMQVINVELNDMDHTNIDSDARRTVIVTIVGRIYDGAISVRDQIEVTGHWSPNHTISASSIHNRTNGSRLAVSHGIPANLGRVLILCGLALLVMMIMWLFGSGSPILGIGNLLSGMFRKVLPLLICLLLLWWFLSGLCRPSRGGRRFFGSLLGLAVGIGIVWYIAAAHPAFLQAAVLIGIMLAGLFYMISAIFK